MKKIRIVSPAKSIGQKHVDYASNFLTQRGFSVEVGKNALGQFNYFSGTIAERLADFQAALNDPAVDIILCARGGYGTVQLIDQLDFSVFARHPKLIVGYSDITVFHNHVPAHYAIPTVHGTAPLNFEENTTASLDALINVFKGQPNRYEIAAHDLNIFGEVEAVVTGGNLAIIYSLLGTDSDVDYKGKLLFIEEIGEAIYAVDRMFYALKKSGKLNEISGLIVGGMTNMKDSEVPFGATVETVIHNHVHDLNIPLCFSFPAGHIPDNRPVIIGKKATLSVGESGVTFVQ